MIGDFYFHPHCVRSHHVSDDPSEEPDPQRHSQLCYQPEWRLKYHLWRHDQWCVNWHHGSGIDVGSRILATGMWIASWMASKRKQEPKEVMKDER